MKKGWIYGFTCHIILAAGFESSQLNIPETLRFDIEGLGERLVHMDQVPQKVHEFQEESTKKETS